MARYPAPSPVYLGPAAHTSAGHNKPIDRVVIHATVSPCKPGGARDIAAYFRSPKSGGSAHYVVDPGEVVQVVHDDTVAWHAPPNPHSIGNELCFMPTRVPVGFWLLPRARRMLRRAAVLTAQQCLAFDVPAVRLSAADLRAGKRGICGHVNVSRAFGQSTHWDPGVFPWRTFMRMVRAEIAMAREAAA